jgi:hypothetical protein
MAQLGFSGKSLSGKRDAKKSTASGKTGKKVADQDDGVKVFLI